MKILKSIVLLGGLVWSVWRMYLITVQYVPIDTDVAFLRIKQDYIDIPYYPIAFFVHVFSSIFVLLAGFTQFSKKILKRMPKLHRYAGRLYVYITLLLAAPSGLIIGIHANGGLLSRTAFCTLAVLWWSSTWLALLAARRKKFIAHRRYMLWSYGLALSAITLRLWKLVLAKTLQPRPMDLYRVVAWLGWVPNLIFAEILAKKRR